MPSIAAYRDWETLELYCPLCASLNDKVYPKGEPMYSTEQEDFICFQCKGKFTVVPTWDNPPESIRRRVYKAMQVLYIWGALIAAFDILFYAILAEHIL